LYQLPNGSAIARTGERCADESLVREQKQITITLETPSSFPSSPPTMSLPYPTRQLYYNGQVRAASSGKTFQTINPATATPLADIEIAAHADVDKAIAAADKAFPQWSNTPHIARARILHKAATLLRERNDEIAKIETLDSGKAFTETSTVDVVTGADVLEYYANFIGGGGLNGETTQLREDAWVYSKKAPLGVCAGIGAWNYPIQMYDFPVLCTRRPSHTFS
jgi:betaine-aldehyde dehydrogenase